MEFFGANEGVILNGFENTAQTGYSVSGAGDVNGDGFDDVLVATRLANPTGDFEDDDTGIVHVVFGRTSTSAITLDNLGSEGFQIYGANGGDELGFGLSGAGDVNGDGLADNIIGSVQYSGQGAATGVAYLIFGKTDSTTVDLGNLANDGFIIQSPGSGDLTGSGVSGAGDVNGDGLADLIIGAPGGDTNGSSSGESFVVFGKADTQTVSLGSLGTGGFRIDGMAQGDQAGSTVAGAGDINRDGFADVIIGSRFADPDGRVNAGESYVVFGKADNERVNLQEQGTSAFEIEGHLAGDRAGRSVSAPGDVNGDGLADLMIGAYLATGGAPYAGRSYVVFNPLEQSLFPVPYKAIAKSGDAPVLAVGTTGDGDNISSPDSRCWIDFEDGSGPGLDGSSLQTVTIANGFLISNIDGNLPVDWLIETDRTGWTSAEITLRYTEAELEGFPENNLEVYQATNDNGPWTQIVSKQSSDRNEFTFDTTTLGYFTLATGVASPEVTLTTDANTFVNDSIRVVATFTEEVTGFTSDDLVIDNATVENFAVTGNPLVYEFDLTGLSDDLFSVQVPVNVSEGTSGQGNRESNLLARFFDQTRPTATLSTLSPDPTNQPFIVTSIFNENVTDFELDDLTITNGSASNRVENSAGSYDFTVTPDANGNVSVQVNEDAGFDAAGNGNTESNILEIFNDAIGPDITLVSTSPLLTSQTVIIRAQFTEVPFDVQLGDISVINGTASFLQQTGTPTIYVYRLDADSDGEVTTFFSADTVTDELGNPNTESNTLSFTFDTTAPVPTLATSAGPTPDSTKITVTFNEEVTGFESDDVSISNGTISDFQVVAAGVEFEFVVEPTGTETVTFSVPTGAARDLAGNENADSNVIQINNDSEGPAITLSSNSPMLTNETVLVQAEFSELPVGFELGDITVTNGTATMLQQTATSTIYEYMLDSDADGNVTTFIGAGTVTDGSGNPGTASNTLQFTFDTTPPIPTLSSQAGPTQNTTQITVSFSEEITGFDSTDVSIQNGTLSDFMTNVAGEEFQFLVQPTGTESITISVPSDSATDLAGNENVASNSIMVNGEDLQDLWMIE